MFSQTELYAILVIDFSRRKKSVHVIAKMEESSFHNPRTLRVGCMYIDDAKYRKENSKQ